MHHSWILLYVLVKRLDGQGIFPFYRLFQDLPVKKHIVRKDGPSGTDRLQNRLVVPDIVYLIGVYKNQVPGFF